MREANNGGPAGGVRHRAGLRVRLLDLLARLAYRHPWPLVAGGVLLAGAALLATSKWLAFQTSRDDLISPRKEYVKVYKAYQREFGDFDDLVIVVEGDDLRQSKALATELAGRLEKDPAAAREVLYRIDPESFRGKALLYLTPAELRDLKTKLGEHRDLVEKIAADPSLATLLRAINREISAAMVGHLVSSFLGVPSEGEDGEERPLDLGLLQTLVKSIGQAVTGAPYGSLWRAYLRPDSDMDEDGFLVDDSRRFVFVLVLAPEDTALMASAADAIARVRGHIAAVRPRYPGIDVGVTGGPALATEEMQASVVDTTLASVLALIGVGACFVLFYRDVARPLLAVFTLGVGLAWSFGYITVTIGHLTILSVSFATILIGMSDDFGVHLISRFEEEIAGGHPAETALRRTFVHSGGGIISGAVTFAIAFFAMVFTDFLGMAELGVIGGGGIVLCLAAMLTVFPACLVLYERFRARWLGRWVDEHARLPARLSAWRPHAIERMYRWPKLMLAAAGVLTGIGLFALPRLRLDLNMLNLQARDTESVRWELRILESASRSSWYAVSIAATVEEARRLEDAYSGLPEVGRVESIASLIPDAQEERIAAVNELRPVVEGLPKIAAPSGTVEVKEIHELLQSIRFKLQGDGDEPRWDPKRKPLEAALREVRAELGRVEPLLAASDYERARRGLVGLQREVFLDFADQMDFLRRNTRAEPITIDGIPPLLKRRFIASSGRFLVQVFPEKNIWRPENLADFVSALRRVDAGVTGGPVSFFETSQLMRDGYIHAGLYALAAICVLVLYDFRELRLALLALVPLGIGGVWTAAVMWLFDLPFNLANLIILPLIAGIGISNGIHIIHRHIEDGSHEMSVIARSTGKAVVLSSVTTMVGFGSLMVARHQGVFSLGLLLTVGIGCNLLASVTVLPSILRYLPISEEHAEAIRLRQEMEAELRE